MAAPQYKTFAKARSVAALKVSFAGGLTLGVETLEVNDDWFYGACIESSDNLSAIAKVTPDSASKKINVSFTTDPGAAIISVFAYSGAKSQI